MAAECHGELKKPSNANRRQIIPWHGELKKPSRRRCAIGGKNYTANCIIAWGAEEAVRTKVRDRWAENTK